MNPLDACARQDESTKGRRGRRDLRFASLGDVMPEVERLLLGHVVVGRWSLGVVCNHLRVGFEMSMDGFPERGPLIVRRKVGQVARWWVLLWSDAGITLRLSRAGGRKCPACRRVTRHRRSDTSRAPVTENRRRNGAGPRRPHRFVGRSRNHRKASKS